MAFFTAFAAQINRQLLQAVISRDFKRRPAHALDTGVITC